MRLRQVVNETPAAFDLHSSWHVAQEPEKKFKLLNLWQKQNL